MHREDNLSPDERFHEVAAILAAGLLRLKSRATSAQEFDASAPQETLGFAKKPLECPAEKRLHVHTA